MHSVKVADISGSLAKRGTPSGALEIDAPFGDDMFLPYLYSTVNIGVCKQAMLDVS